MNPDQQVVEAIFKTLLVENVQRYQQALFQPTNNDRGVYGLASLNNNEKEALLKFLKLAIADSASLILGTLDGSCFPEGINGDFVVSYDGNEVQGDLQDLFIEKAERAGIYG